MYDVGSSKVNNGCLLHTLSGEYSVASMNEVSMEMDGDELVGVVFPYFAMDYQ